VVAAVVVVMAAAEVVVVVVVVVVAVVVAAAVVGTNYTERTICAIRLRKAKASLSLDSVQRKYMGLKGRL
jgi:hypothetical protein